MRIHTLLGIALATLCSSYVSPAPAPLPRDCSGCDSDLAIVSFGFTTAGGWVFDGSFRGRSGSCIEIGDLQTGQIYCDELDVCSARITLRYVSGGGSENIWATVCAEPVGGGTPICLNGKIGPNDPPNGGDPPLMQVAQFDTDCGNATEFSVTVDGSTVSQTQNCSACM